MTQTKTQRLFQYLLSKYHVNLLDKFRIDHYQLLLLTLVNNGEQTGNKNQADHQDQIYGRLEKHVRAQ